MREPSNVVGVTLSRLFLARIFLSFGQSIITMSRVLEANVALTADYGDRHVRMKVVHVQGGVQLAQSTRASRTPMGSLRAQHRDGSLGPYFNERFHTTLTNVWRRRRLVIATVAVALVIGIALALTMPKRYTAEAYVRERVQG